MRFRISRRRTREPEAPQWMRDNPSIVRGFRREGQYRGCLGELLSWHNETLNAWTMILGSAVSLALWGWSFSFTACRPDAQMVFFTLMLSGVVGTPASVQYHLMCSVSADSKHACRRADVRCIFLASTLLTFALALFVLPLWGTCILVLLSARLCIDTWLHYPGTDDDKIALARRLAKTVGMYLAPMAFAFCVHGLPHFWAALLSLAVGASLYVANVPERWAPGCFDHVGQSHQLMHLCIIAAHVTEFMFVRRLVLMASK